MQLRILYIPGLGDRYDAVRRLGLLTWRRPDVAVELVPMRWSDPKETFEQKLARIKTVIDADPSPVVLVGESAGGAMVIAATHESQERIAATVTLCGMNRGAKNVNDHFYKRNPAFRAAMKAADMIVPAMEEAIKQKMLIIYSSKDRTVQPKDTLIDSVKAEDLRVKGHALSILSVLFRCYRLPIDLWREKGFTPPL